MASTTVTLNSILILRILTLLFCAASIVLIVTNKYEILGEKTKFTDIIAYRYVLASGAIGSFYALIQIPFAFYHACTQKRWIRDGYLPEFDFYGDKVIGMLLASGVGVGFGASFELKKTVDVLFDLILFIGIQDFDVEGDRSKTKKFFDRAIFSTCMLLGAFTCMLALTLIFTSMARRR